MVIKKSSGYILGNAVSMAGSLNCNWPKENQVDIQYA